MRVWQVHLSHEGGGTFNICLPGKIGGQIGLSIDTVGREKTVCSKWSIASSAD